MTAVHHATGKTFGRGTPSPLTRAYRSTSRRRGAILKSKGQLASPCFQELNSLTLRTAACLLLCAYFHLRSCHKVDRQQVLKAVRSCPHTLKSDISHGTDVISMDASEDLYCEDSLLCELGMEVRSHCECACRNVTALTVSCRVCT